jgi:GntR family transcriptional regulator of vanillate catabolism
MQTGISSMNDISTARTLTQSAVESIRSMIVGGEIRPGERLQAQMLADRLGVSRTPIADALAILHKEGLLEYAPNRGYGVKPFDLNALLAAFDVRLTLEGLASRLVAEKGLGPESAGALRANLDRTEQLVFGPTWSAVEQEGWRVLNLQFHDLLIDAAGNPYLKAGVDNTRVLPLIYGRAVQPIGVEELRRRFAREQTQQAFRDHQRVFDAVEARQGTRAEHMMREHIYANREKLRRELEIVLGGAISPR